MSEEKKGKVKVDLKRIIILAVVIAVVVAVIIIIAVNNKNQELYTTLEDGTRVNTSKDIVKTRNVDVFEMTDFEIQEKDDFSTLIANVKNTSAEEKTNVNFDIDVKDKDGNIIITMGGYIYQVGPGETARMSASATCDFSEAADLEIRLADQSVGEEVQVPVD